MTLNEKIEVVKEFKTSAIAALNSYLDSLYGLTDEYFDSEGNLIEGLTPDMKLENFIKGMREESFKFERVRRKLLDEEFNLSLFEINLIAAAFVYVSGVWEKDIQKLIKAKEEADNVIRQLTSKVDED